MPKDLHRQTPEEGSADDEQQNKKLDGSQIGQLEKIIGTIIDFERIDGKKNFWKGMTVSLLAIMVIQNSILVLIILTV